MVFKWGKKATPKEEEAEMSMEEILNSIRKYVIEEKPSHLEHGHDLPERRTKGTDDYDDDDVIHLTKTVDEPSQPHPTEAANKPSPPPISTQPFKSVSTSTNIQAQSHPGQHKPAPAPVPAPPAMPQQQSMPAPQPQAAPAPQQQSMPAPQPQAAPAPQQQSMPAPQPQAAPAPQQQSMPAPQPQAASQEKDGILSSQALLASTQALSRLVSATQSSQTKVSSNMTLEQLIAELTRPMIKEWLDKNLPAIVETTVAREIERITKDLLPSKS